ncbi:hypothetical protein BGX31_010256 [Mortierella sp. GBA43]|nr:hypothetical protein BGX31_010256 [Mortierella sp. GBA43]
MASTPRSPLDIPEIRQWVGRYLMVKDAISCAQVCKSWTDDFLSSIWHTVAGSTCQKLASSDRKFLSKHGHRIRVLRNIQGVELPNRLHNASVCQLSEIVVTTGANHRMIAQYYDLIQRNVKTLTRVKFAMSQGTGELYFNVDCLAPHALTGATSKLTHLELSGVLMTRNSFSRLKICPRLECLEIFNTTLESTVATDKYKHPSLWRLVAPIEQVFRVDPSRPTAPSLLMHLPGLTHWWIWENQKLDIEIDTIPEELQKCCSHFTSILADCPRSSRILKGLKGLTEIQLYQKDLSPELVMAITTHKDTLTTVAAALEDRSILQSTNVAQVSKCFETHGWTLQFIPSHCHKLKKLSFPKHEMHMDDIDRFPWVCRDLEELHIRIKDLNTKDLIDGSLSKWLHQKSKRSARKNGKNLDPEDYDRPSSSTAIISDPVRQMVPIDVRVANHLAQFEKLQHVWLGTKVWRA